MSIVHWQVHYLNLCRTVHNFHEDSSITVLQAQPEQSRTFVKVIYSLKCHSYNTNTNTSASDTCPPSQTYLFAGKQPPRFPSQCHAQVAACGSSTLCSFPSSFPGLSPFHGDLRGVAETTELWVKRCCCCMASNITGEQTFPRVKNIIWGLINTGAYGED